ncbi:sensor histidine kinase, partial [Microbacteriaceae bacterium K1510]|nr:sensor histidine kinase [Microbacteriaceae bacterium K1510]
IESVSQMMHMGRVDLSELIRLIQQRLSVLNPDIVWELNLPDTLPLEGDGEQLSTAFLNILENQLRYAKSKLVIRGCLSDNGEKVEISMSNDCPPIEEALLPNLFQRFRKGKSGKHGLGLAIARAVIEAHGGSIHARNEATGPCFYVFLPMKR